MGDGLLPRLELCYRPFTSSTATVVAEGHSIIELSGKNGETLQSSVDTRQ